MLTRASCKTCDVECVGLQEEGCTCPHVAGSGWTKQRLVLVIATYFSTYIRKYQSICLLFQQVAIFYAMGRECRTMLNLVSVSYLYSSKVTQGHDFSLGAGTHIILQSPDLYQQTFIDRFIMILNLLKVRSFVKICMKRSSRN